MRKVSESQEASHHCLACGVTTLWLASNTIPRRCLEFPEFAVNIGFLLENSKLWCYHTIWLLFFIVIEHFQQRFETTELKFAV